MIDWLREWWQRQRYRRWRRKWATYIGVDVGAGETTVVTAIGTPKGTYVIDEITRRTSKDFEFALARAKLSNLKRTSIAKIQTRMDEGRVNVFDGFLDSRKGDDK